MAITPFLNPQNYRPPIGSRPTPSGEMDVRPATTPAPRMTPVYTQTIQNPYASPFLRGKKRAAVGDEYKQYQAGIESKNRNITQQYMNQIAPRVAEFEQRYGSQGVPREYIESMYGAMKPLERANDFEAFVESQGYSVNPLTGEYVNVSDIPPGLRGILSENQRDVMSAAGFGGRLTPEQERLRDMYMLGPQTSASMVPSPAPAATPIPIFRPLGR